MKLVKNVLLILIGLVIIGIGASTLRVAGLGVDYFILCLFKKQKSHWSRNYFKYAFSRNFDSTDFYLASTLRQ